MRRVLLTSAAVTLAALADDVAIAGERYAEMSIVGF
jgi:hypothetical protein